MIGGEMDTSGLDRVIRRLERMDSRATRAAHNAAETGLIYLQSRVPTYSSIPRRAGQTYRRTGLLGRSITSMAGGGPQALSRVRSLGGRVVGIWGSAVRYAKYVIGEKDQAWMHLGRWYTLQGLIRKNRSELVRHMAKRLFEDLLRE